MSSILNQAGRLQVPVSAVVSVQADGREDQLWVSPAQWPTCWSLTTGLLTLSGGAEVVTLSFQGLFLFPTLLLDRDPAVTDQYFKGTMHQVKAANSELQLLDLLLRLQLAGGRLHLVHRHGLPLEELVCHGRVPLWLARTGTTMGTR